MPTASLVFVGWRKSQGVAPRPTATTRQARRRGWSNIITCPAFLRPADQSRPARAHPWRIERPILSESRGNGAGEREHREERSRLVDHPPEGRSFGEPVEVSGQVSMPGWKWLDHAGIEQRRGGGAIRQAEAVAGGPGPRSHPAIDH